MNFEKWFNNNFTNEIKENIALKTAGLNLITISTILKKGLEYIGLNLNKDVSHILANKLGQHVELFYPRYGFDKIIGYESTPIKQVVAILEVIKEQDEERIYFKKVESLSSPIDLSLLKACPGLENMEFFI